MRSSFAARFNEKSSPSCSVGFEIPVTECFKTGTLAKAGLLVCCIFGKLAMGCFAQPRDADHFWILAFAWGEWGEFSFLIATAARRVGGDGILDSGTYNAICLAVLASMIICPAGLRSTLEAYERKAKFQIAEAIADTADVSGAAHATYFCLQTKSHATWEQSDHLLAATTRMGCDIIDSRQWHPNDHFGLAHCVNEMYIRDTSLELPTTLDMDEAQEARLQARIDEILDAVRAALREDEHRGAEIRVQRWLPGCHVERDEASGRPRLATNADAIDGGGALPCGGGFFFGAGARVFFFVADDDRDDADRDDDRGAACFVALRPRGGAFFRGRSRDGGRLDDFESREAGQLDALAELSRDAGRLAGGVWALSRGSGSGSGRGTGSGSGSGASARASLSFFTFSRSVRPRSAAQSRVAAAASSASPGGGSIVRRSADGPPTSATRARPTSSQGEGPCTACVSRSRRAFSDALSFSMAAAASGSRWARRDARTASMLRY